MLTAQEGVARATNEIAESGVIRAIGESHEACKSDENPKTRDIRQLCAIRQIRGLGQILDTQGIRGIVGNDNRRDSLQNAEFRDFHEIHEIL